MSKSKRKVSSECDGLCKGWTNPGVFQQVNKASRTNITIYQYYDTGDQKTNQSRLLANDHIIIVQNKSDTNISKNEILNEISKSMCNCPHCFEVMKHVCELLNQLDAMKKNEIRGICDHCRMHAGKYCNKCTKCRMAINDFLTSQVEWRNTARVERVQAWMNKVRDLLKTNLGQGGIRQAKEKFYSDTQLNKLLKMLKSPRSTRQLNIDVMDLGDLRRIESDVKVVDNGTEVPTYEVSKDHPEKVLSELLEEEEIAMGDFNIPEGIKRKKLEAESKKQYLKEKELAEARVAKHKEETEDKDETLQKKTKEEKADQLNKRDTLEKVMKDKGTKSDEHYVASREDEIIKEKHENKDGKEFGSKEKKGEKGQDPKRFVSGSKQKEDGNSGKKSGKGISDSKEKKEKGDVKGISDSKEKKEKGNVKGISDSKEKKEKGDLKGISDSKEKKEKGDAKDVAGSKQKNDGEENKQEVANARKENKNSKFDAKNVASSKEKKGVKDDLSESKEKNDGKGKKQEDASTTKKLAENKDGKDGAKVAGSKQKKDGTDDAKDVSGLKEKKDGKGDTKDLTGSKEKKDGKGDMKDLSGSKEKKDGKGETKDLSGSKEKKDGKGDTKDLSGSEEKKDGKGDTKYLSGSKEKKDGKGDAKDLFVSKEKKDGKGEAKDLSSSKDNKDEKGEAKFGSKEKKDAKEKKQDDPRAIKKDNEKARADDKQKQKPELQSAKNNELTQSQIKLFREQAESRKPVIFLANAARSRMTKFNEKIFRELNLDKLPDTGEIYRSSPELNLLDLHMINSPKSKSEGKTWKSPRDMLKVPSKGIREPVFSKVVFELKGEQKDGGTKQSKGNVLRDSEFTAQQFQRPEYQRYEYDKMIIGSKICKYNHNLLSKTREESEVVPLLYKVKDKTEQYVPKKAQLVDARDADTETGQKLKQLQRQPEITKGTGVMGISADPPKGVIRFELSDRQFIEKGWTMLPTEKIVRKMNIYRMQPAQPKSDWFARNKEKGLLLYDTGERLAEFEEDGRARWFYRNGRTALHYYSAEEMNVQQRYVVYSSGSCAPGECGMSRPSTVLASFDWLGNGIVLDHAGKIRLKYNQTEGVLLDRALGPVTHWKWHSLNDPPVLQQVMIDTRLSHKEPEILKHDTGELTARQKNAADNDEMLAVEFDNFIKEKSKKLTQKYMPYQIKMKALKINEHFSLRILDQATIYLLFRDEKHSLKLNIGMVLDRQTILDTVTAEVGEVSTSYDILPAKTESLEKIQQMVANAVKYEKMQNERINRIRRPERHLSIDNLIRGNNSKPAN